MNKLALLTTVVLSVGATACTIEAGSDLDIDATNLSGYVAGQPWSFVAGHTSAFLSEGEDDFFATLYPSAFTPCGFSEPNTPHLIVAIPKTTGEFDMGLGLNMTFVDGSDNLVSFDGRIRVDSISATSIKGGMAASYDLDNEVSGMFDVTICEE